MDNWYVHTDFFFEIPLVSPLDQPLTTDSSGSFKFQLDDIKGKDWISYKSISPEYSFSSGSLKKDYPKNNSSIISKVYNLVGGTSFGSISPEVKNQSSNSSDDNKNRFVATSDRSPVSTQLILPSYLRSLNDSPMMESKLKVDSPDSPSYSSSSSCGLEVVSDVTAAKKCVLVADDNIVVRKMLERSIISLGYDCIGAEDGSVALSLLEKSNFDCLIIDNVYFALNLV